MLTCTSGISAYLVTDLATILGESECILLGTGAHSNIDIAIEKATQEYTTMNLNHFRNPNRCRWLEQNMERIPTIMDRHHIASRDPRNLFRFRKLCALYLNNHSSPKFERPKIQDELWKIEKLESPVRTFKFIKAFHPDLIDMEFGLPEPFTSEGSLPLFHPYW